MKLNGIIGKGTGKLGSSVFAISGGEQVVREYNPVVSNPNTDAQVAQRAKLKLMSQLVAVLAPALAFKKQGLVSARNQFVSKNIGLCAYEDNQAHVEMRGLQFTPGSKDIPQPATTGYAEGGYPVKLSAAPSADVKAVVYVLVRYTDGNQIKLVTVKPVTEAGLSSTFDTTITAPQGESFLYAYGITDASAVGRINYDDYVVSEDDEWAALGVVSSLIKNATTFTRTSSTAF